MPEEKRRKSIRVGEIDKMSTNCSRWKGLTVHPSITRIMRSHTCRIWQIIWIG